jgi:hypothetical protein
MVYASGTSSSVTTGNFTAMSVTNGYGGNVDFTPTFGVSEQKTATSNVLARQFAPPPTNLANIERENLKSYMIGWLVF